MSPHHEDDDLAVNTTQFLRDKEKHDEGPLPPSAAVLRMREAMTISLKVPSYRFAAPWLHLNHLPSAMEQEFDLLRRRASRRFMPFFTPQDVHAVMVDDWQRIESAAESTGYEIFSAMKQYTDLRRDLLDMRMMLARIQAYLMARRVHPAVDITGERIMVFLPTVYETDYTFVIRRDVEYNASWLRRGGVGAFMMLARKWDRYAPMVEKHDCDMIEMLTRKPDRIDDVQDLRNYLLLVESEWIRREKEAH